MNYQKLRQEASKWIENFVFIQKTTNLAPIHYNINKMYGLGQTFVIKQIKILQQIGMVKYDEKYDIVYWIAPNPPLKTKEEIKEETEVEFFLQEQKHTPPAMREE
jgi:hypothetical protein